MLTNNEFNELNKYGWKFSSKKNGEVIYTNNGDNKNFIGIIDLLINKYYIDYQVDPSNLNRATLKINIKN